MNMMKRCGPQPMQIGVCRLCGEKRKCRDVNIVYEYMGKSEVYSDMLQGCFGIELTKHDMADGLACAPCVVRLRSSCDFKRQVLRCESLLLKRVHGESSKSESFVKDEGPVYIEMESLDGSVFCDDDDDDDDDNKTLDKFKVELNADIASEPHCATDKQSFLRDLLQKNADKTIAKPMFKHLAKPTKARTTLKTVVAKKQLDEERQLKMKKLLLLKMEKLKAEQKNKLANSAALPIGKHRRKGKDCMAFQNTVQIVESSYVCPFKNITGTYYCYYCRTVFRDPADLRTHSATHDPAPFARLWPKNKAVKLDITRIDCRHCDATITDIPTLKQHLTDAHARKFHPVENEFLQFKLTHPEIECLECGLSFLFIDRLIKHMTVHFGNCVCDKCGASFIQPSSLEAHLRCHDKLDKRFPCHICGKNLSTNRSRHVHVAVVHEKKPVIDCFHCERRFFSYDHRNKHMVEEHNHNNSIPCAVCGKVFDTRKKFTMHNQMVHLKEYKHGCEVCDKKFITIKQFNKHMKIHDVKD